MIEKTYTLSAGGKSYTFKGGTDREFQQDALKILNDNFRAVSLEKYDDAIMNLVMSEGLKKYGRGKERLSYHQYSRIQKHMISRLQSMYGPYVTVQQRKGRFACNLSGVFKTDQGRLYNSLSIMNLFITSHALDRFDERSKAWEEVPEIVQFKLKYKEVHGTSPTAFDFLDFMLERCRHFLVIGDSWYFYTGIGCLVVEIYDIIAVGKTFLDPQMVPKGHWQESPFAIEVIIPIMKDKSPFVETPFFLPRENENEPGNPT